MQKSPWKAPQKATTTTRNFLRDTARIFITHSIFINFILLYTPHHIRRKSWNSKLQWNCHKHVRMYSYLVAKKAHETYRFRLKTDFLWFFSKWNAVWIYSEFQNDIRYIDANPSKSSAFGMGLGTQAHECGKKHQFDACTVHCSNTRNDSNSSMLYVKREAVIYFIFFSAVSK